MEVIIDLLIYIPMITLIIVVLLLLQKVQEYRDEVEYLKSVCEQAVQVSEQTEKKLNEHISKSKQNNKRSFMIGYEKGRKKK